MTTAETTTDGASKSPWYSHLYFQVLTAIVALHVLSTSTATSMYILREKTIQTSYANEEEIKAVQKIVGRIFYYARAVNMTVLMALSTIASEQTKGTEQTMD